MTDTVAIQEQLRTLLNGERGLDELLSAEPAWYPVLIRQLERLLRPLSAREIVEAVGAAVGWQGGIVGLDDGVPGGEHPWSAPHPIVLDTTAAAQVRYRPVGPGRALLAEEARWVASAPGCVKERTGAGYSSGLSPQRRRVRRAARR